MSFGLLAQLLVNGVFVGSVYALLGLSFAMIFATNRIWHFAQGAVYTAGAYALYSAAHLAGLPLPIALLVGMVVAGGLGAACVLLLYRPLQHRRRATQLVMVMASLGAMIIVENVIVLLFGPSGLSMDIAVPDPLLLGPVFITGGQLVAAPSALVIAALFVILLRFSRTGRLIRALVSNPELVQLNGFNVRRMQLLAFVVGSALLPVAALLLLAGNAGITPTMGIPAVLTGAMAMFFGGVDRIEGAAVAGFAMGIIESLASFFFPTEWQTAVTYSVVLIFLVLRPTGLFGRSLPQRSL